MSLIKANAVQIGQSALSSQNFTLAVPSSPDGTIKLARGNSGATTQDVLSVDASGNVSFAGTIPSGNISNSTAIATGSTTARSLANRFADVVNVKDFGAVGDGVTDDTAAIQAAIAYCDTVDYEEKTLVFPAGNYLVDSIDLTNRDFITFVADGTVQITGGNSSASNFIFGSTNYNSSNPPASTITRYFSMKGGWWLIAPKAGQSYTYAMRLEHFVSGVFEKVSVSGNFGPASGADRISTYLQYSYVNSFYNCSFSSPGIPGAGYYSYAVKMGNNNNNLNLFSNCRGVGIIGNPSAANTVIIGVKGTANTIEDCDLSGCYYGIDITGSRGGVFKNNYHEAVNEIITTGIGPGNAFGNTFIGGFYEILTNGKAFVLGNLGGSQNTSIIGCKIRGIDGGSNRTFIDQVSSGTTYGLSVINPDLQNIDTQITGTYRGNIGSVSLGIIQPQWVSFPATNVVSTDANTLDDYKEGSWTPTKTTGTAFATASGRFTKIGNVVMASFVVTFAAETNASSAAIGSFPFSTGALFTEQNGLAVGYNTSSTNVGGTLTGTTLTLQKIGAGGGIASITNMSGATLSGIVTYFTSQ